MRVAAEVRPVQTVRAVAVAAVAVLLLPPQKRPSFPGH